MLYDNILNLCKIKGITPSKMADQCGISRAAVSKWKNIGYSPRRDKLEIIADYFGVSVDFLLGKEEKEKSEPIGISEKFAHDYYLLDNEDKETVDLLVSSLLQKEKYKKQVNAG